MKFDSRLYGWYWALERRVLGVVHHAQQQYEHLLIERVRPASRWLDLGCGRELLPRWRRAVERALVSRTALLVGVDGDLQSLRENGSVPLRCEASASALPFPDASFDVITANMVLEHIADPHHVLGEIRRVLTPGGSFIVHTPNAQSFPTALIKRIPYAVKILAARLLERRNRNGVFRTFYRANDRSTLDRLASDAGLDVVELRFATSIAVFALVPPLALLELLWLRFVSAERRSRMRPNLLLVLSRPG